MITFKISNLYERYYNLYRNWVEDGTAFYMGADNGCKIFYCHGTEDGYLLDDHLNLNKWEIEHLIKSNTVVIACFPKAVRKRYPRLKVVGGWEEITSSCLHWKDEKLYVVPKSQIDRLEAIPGVKKR